MMQSGSVQTNGVGLLSSLLAGIGETSVSDPAAGQGFLDTLQTQIRSLLVDAGEDPDEIAALDAQALMAQFMALMQPSTAAPKLVVGETLLPIPLTSTQTTAMPSDLLQKLLQSAPPDGSESVRRPAVLTELDETGQTSSLLPENDLASLQALSAGVVRQLLQSLPATGAAVAPSGSAPTDEAAQELSARLQSLPADTLRQLLQSLPTAGATVAPTASAAADDVVQELSERLLSLPADTLRRLLQSLPVEGATMAPGAAAGDDDVGQTAILKAVSLDLLRQISQEQSRTDDDDRQPAADLAIKAQAGQPLPLLRESLPGLMADGLAQLAGRESSDLPASPTTGLSLAALSTAGTTPGETPGGLPRAAILDLSKLLQPGGDARLAEQVKWFVQAGLGTAEMKLHPANLGALDVRVTMEADKAHVQFLSPHPIVREVIEAALPRLREALAQDGLSLGNVSVSDQTARRGEPDQGQGRDGSGYERQDFDDFGADVNEAPEFADSTLSVLARRLDYFV